MEWRRSIRWTDGHNTVPQGEGASCMRRLFSLGSAAISSAADDVLMVGSCPLCGLGLTIFDTACFDSPTACAMSFCLCTASARRTHFSAADPVRFKLERCCLFDGYVFVGAANTGESPSSRGLFSSSPWTATAPPDRCHGGTARFFPGYAAAIARPSDQ